ncbi:MAG: M15 family metallopeptidase [Candidatus Merdivicinus sp.]|jgi:D-alanyl-D-alanine dipeptidase/carboxypeptidase
MREVFPGADAVYQGQLILVNAGTPLRREPAEPLSAIRPGVQLENCAAEQLRKLLADIRAGSAITAVSGYRSHFEQTQIYEKSVRENGADFTRQYVALPGCSEHQTGLAVDLGESRPQIDFIRPDFPDSGVCGEFRRRAAEYGFFLRYPAGKEKITGIACEPWHFRYVGWPHSQLIQEYRLALEEYLELLRDYPEDGPHLYFQSGKRVAEIWFQHCLAGEAPVLRLPEGIPCQVSGNNMDGLVVTAWRTA